MAQSTRRRNSLIALLIAIIVIILLLVRCLPKNQPPAQSAESTSSAAPVARAERGTQGKADAAGPPERLTQATLAAPVKVAAGAAITVNWEGPDNPGDFVIIVKQGAMTDAKGDYRVTQSGKTLTLTAPMDVGPHEIRYVAGSSRTILGRASIQVEPVAATIEAPEFVVLGSEFEVRWTGPNNKGDYITIVRAGAPDAEYGDYVETDKGAAVTLRAPSQTSDAEVRYVGGQDRKVIARRVIRIVAAAITLSAPSEAVAGSTVEVVWTGPNNAGDYITVVPEGAPDGQYGSYMDTSKGSPLKLMLPIMNGRAEVRYVSGQGRKVLSRRAIGIVAASISLSAVGECAPGADVAVEWTGPNNPGDYITIVPRTMPDGQYAGYTNTSKGSPLTVKAPAQAGPAEIRYMTGQGNKVLARRPITVGP